MTLFKKCEKVSYKLIYPILPVYERMPPRSIAWCASILSYILVFVNLLNLSVLVKLLLKLFRYLLIARLAIEVVGFVWVVL